LLPAEAITLAANAVFLINKRRLILLLYMLYEIDADIKIY
jgi:hypothetical protein